MSSSLHKLLRLLVLSLLIVFISETVYASGMMTSVQIASNHTEIHVEPCHKASGTQHANEKQHAHASCKDCSHCSACVSMMLQTFLSAPVIQKQLITMAALVEVYHSPSTAQPQKPPIA